MPEVALAIAVVAASAALSAILILLLKPLLDRHVLARPNARSSHSVATPQGAGAAVMLAVVAVSGFGLVLLPFAPGAPSLVPVLAAGLFLTLIGLADDAKALSASWRFLGQTLAAAVIVSSLPAELRFFPDLLPLVAERGLLLIGVIWFVNAVNFLDGIDWITVGQVVPMTLGIAILAYLGAVPAKVGLLAIALLGGMIGFAPFNRHPAKLFLGDAGSLPVGLCLAFMLIVVAYTDKAAALLLALYTIADATLTLCRRAWHKEPIFSAHRSHFYQRAVAGGCSVPQVSGRVFALGLLLAGLAIAAVMSGSAMIDWALLTLGALATGLLLYRFERGR
jgi:UDP-N-acetylmuramyl pentapeptide phosphotransferase/UDP-N-acetylglucosamine-1-phosphate transferase